MEYMRSKIERANEAELQKGDEDGGLDLDASAINTIANLSIFNIAKLNRASYNNLLKNSRFWELSHIM